MDRRIEERADVCRREGGEEGGRGGEVKLGEGRRGGGEKRGEISKDSRDEI